MLSPRLFDTMRCASALGLLLLISAQGQVWPWLVSEKLNAERAARTPAQAAPTDPGAPAEDDESDPEPEQRPLAVLTALPDPSPQRTRLLGFSAAGERPASLERGTHATGSPTGISPKAPPAATIDACDWPFEGCSPAPARLAAPTAAPVVRVLPLGTCIVALAPPA
jgi:hypothetical protein